ncbi:scavenger receptor class F member 1 [Ctenodactylus gundi]
MELKLLLPLLLLWTQGSQGTKLDPNGQNVCKGNSYFSAELQCCPGWSQKDGECTIPICEGPDTCRKEEVCVKPGVCRCKPGFFGADCSSRCPGQYWGPDCREPCPCHPHGQCEPATGVCRCNKDRWGSLCERQCFCGSHGHCDPKTGVCICDSGWWSSTCNRQCLCNPEARCNPVTGACVCPLGFWGRRCNFKCYCPKSSSLSCQQDTGLCNCLPGWWGAQCNRQCECVRGNCSLTSGQCACPPGFQGPRCEQPCAPGRYGVQCRLRCGHCKQNTSCSSDTGHCESCKPGWNGTRCQEPCLPGTFGDNCSKKCPHCRLGEPCQPETGLCQHCDPGWQGPSCEHTCPAGTFGDGCSSTCPTCIQGTCDPATGGCVCSHGYWGPSCNSSCPPGFYGSNCSSPCQCSEGTCHPASGACSWGLHGKDAALVAGILVPLLLLLLGTGCCVYCFWVTRQDHKDRPVRGAAALSRMKQQVWGTLSSLCSALHCGSLSGYKLPWVTVSHHDPEVPFNHSFIEQPSAGWASDDSFSSDAESGVEDEDRAYCVSHRKGTVPTAHAESPEAALPPPEDASTPFPIPRTSSLARSKRPSVSFAEGTKFVSQNCRSSGELSSPIRKPKRLSKGAQPGPEGQEAEEATGPEQLKADKAPVAAARTKDSATGHQSLHGGQKVAENLETTEGNVPESSDSVATIYMLAGTPQKSEGPIWSVFRRFGNLQKGQEEAKVRSAIPKPPRRALGQKGSTGLASGSASQSPGLALKAKFAETVESTGDKAEDVSREQGDGIESSGSVQEPVSRSSLPEQDPQNQAEEDVQENPLYENFLQLSGQPKA